MSMVIRWLGMLVWVVWAGVGVAQEVDDLDKKAIEYSQQGQFELAVQTWEKARSQLASDSSPRKYMDISVDLAAAYQSLGRLQRALEVLQEAKSAAEKSKDSLGLANVLSQFADVYLAMGNLEYKDGHFTENTSQSAWTENLDRAENCLQGKVEECLQRKDVDVIAEKKDVKNVVAEVEKMVCSADRVDKDNNLLKANILNKQGNIFMLRGDHEMALQKYQNALDCVGQDELLKINISLNIAQAKVRKVEFQLRNLRKFEEQQRAPLPMEYPEKIKNFQTTVGDSIKDAVDDIESTLSKVQQLSASREYKLSALTSLVHFVRDLQKTLEKTNFWKSQKLEGLRSTFEGSLVEEIDALKEKSVAETKNYLEKKSLRNEMGGISGNAIPEASNYLAESYADFITERCAKEKQKCHKFIEGAVQFISTSMPSAHSFKFWLQDDIPEECKSACTEQYFSSCGQNKLPETCKEMCTEVPQLFSQNYHPEWRFHLEWQLGRIYKAQQQFSKAVEAYERAVNYLQLVRQSYFGESQAFSEKAEKFYLDRADLLLKSAKKAVTKREEQNLLQLAIDSIESRNEKGLQNYFKDECVTENFQNKEEAKLQGHEVLFYPVVLDDRLELVLKFSDGSIKQVVNFFPIAGNGEHGIIVSSKEDLVKKTVRFRKLSAEALLSPEKKNLARDLYKVLIGPIVNELKERNIETLIIVPSGESFSVPFAALRNEEQDDKYLVEDYALAILPSWKLVTMTPVSPNEEPALLNGLIKNAPPRFENLPNVENEINSITGILKPNEVLLDDTFTISNLMAKKTAGLRYSIIHFATHGEFVEDSQKSFLYVHDGELTLDDLRNLVKVFSSSKYGVELLMLSACETALGVELGMAGTGITAGARSALGTLWKVEEKSTAILVTLFYEKWKDKNNPVAKAIALAEAQRSLLKGDSEEVQRLLLKWGKETKETEALIHKEQETFKNPYYWAGFWLIGNWLK